MLALRWLPTGEAVPQCAKSSPDLVAPDRFETLGELNNVFDEAWKAVAADDYEAGRLAAAAIGRGTETEKPRKPLEVERL